MAMRGFPSEEAMVVRYFHDFFLKPDERPLPSPYSNGMLTPKSPNRQYARSSTLFVSSPAGPRHLFRHTGRCEISLPEDAFGNAGDS